MGTIANLIVNVGADISKFEQGMGKMMSGLGKIGGGFIKAGAVATAALGAGLGVVLNEGIGGIIAMEDASAQLDAVLKSTNGAAGMTKESLLEMATAYQQTTKFAEEDVVAAQNLLLTFTNIGQDVFPQATGTLLDMATAMGGDASSNAIQLGKALNDPVQGISSLSRVGVTFTDTQKAAIQAMVDMGDTAGAQKIILAELNKEFGGSAAAAGETFSGTMTRAKNALGEVAEGVASSLMPYLQQFLDWVLANMPQIQATVDTVMGVVGDAFKVGAQWVSEKLIPALQAIWDWISPYMPQIQAAVETAMGAVGKALQEAGTFIQDTLFPALVDLWNFISPYMPQIQAAFETAFNMARDAIQGVIDVIAPLIEWMIKNNDIVIPLAAGILGAAIAFQVMSWALGIWTAISAAATLAGGGLAAVLAAINWPLVLIAIAIGALIAIGVILWQNWDWIKAKAIEVWENVKAAFSQAWESIKTAVNNMWESIKTAWDNIKTGVSTAVENVRLTITSIFQAVLTFIITTWNNIKTSVSTAANNIWTAVSTAFNNLKTSVSTAIQTAKDTVIRIFQGVLDWFTGLPAKFTAFGTNAFNALKNGITSVLNTITSVVSGGFDGAINFIKGLPGKAFSWGADFLNGIVNGIKSKIGAITSAIAGVGSKIKSFLGFSVPDEGPLHEYESWMPDFMTGLAKGINKNRYLVTDALSGMTGEMSLKVSKPNVNPGERKQAEENAQIVELLRQLLAKDTDVYLDGKKVTSGLYKYFDEKLSDNETNDRVATGGVY